DFLARIGEQVRKIFPETILAREGLSIKLRPEDDQIDEV
ncbi:MAG: MBL fold metallo-hydrolase, partial [Microcystis aeruginosa]